MYLQYLDVLADLFPIIVPAVALFGLIAARTAHFPGAQRMAESLFYGTLVTVALGTIRSTMHNDSAWLLHTASLGFMIIGAAIIAIGSSNRAMTTEY